MAVYIVRRLVAAAFILLAASFIVYILTTFAGDPLEFTLAITNPTQRQAVIDTVTETLSLDVPRVQRYLNWLHRLVVEQDFGLVSQTQQPVSDELARRLPTTIKLVTGATILSIVIGISVGIITALRQYSGLDYLVTFVTFVFFSLPVFWVAVILKAWGGINFNDWLRDGAHFSTTFIVAVALLAALIGWSAAGGRWPRKLAFTVASGLAMAGLLAWISANQWMLNPGFGPVDLRADLARDHGAGDLGAGRLAEHQRPQRRAGHLGHRHPDATSRCRRCSTACRSRRRSSGGRSSATAPTRRRRP